jgi:CheY-like chemotaxis protein
VRTYLAACIEDAGFNVVTAADGVEALERIASAPPDLITLDLVMPRKGGAAVLKELRGKPEWSRIPVIVVTAHYKDELGSEEVKELKGYGVVQNQPRVLMEKPVTPDEMVHTIGEILDVEIEHPSDRGDMEAQINTRLQDADVETLRKIRAMLAANKDG